MFDNNNSSCHYYNDCTFFTTATRNPRKRKRSRKSCISNHKLYQTNTKYNSFYTTIYNTTTYTTKATATCATTKARYSSSTTLYHSIIHHKQNECTSNGRNKFSFYSLQLYVTTKRTRRRTSKSSVSNITSTPYLSSSLVCHFRFPSFSSSYDYHFQKQETKTKSTSRYIISSRLYRHCHFIRIYHFHLHHTEYRIWYFGRQGRTY
mmetsp:Transcript_40556/g.60781  ORF Transcript_40556/g.60781 Transcript_40556/m.60781 type:complete len:206 (-) Transcript_40556:617-1234(-)